MHINFPKMKKYFTQKNRFPVIILFVFALIVNSCKKDDMSGKTYFMSFTANGTKVEYTVEGALVATFSDAGNQHIGFFSGYNSITNLNLQVYDDVPISVKSYTGYNISNSILLGVLIGYDDESGTDYTQVGDDLVVNVTSITDTSVSGTFSGTLKANGKPDIVIAGGKFTVKRFN